MRRQRAGRARYALKNADNRYYVKEAPHEPAPGSVPTKSGSRHAGSRVDVAAQDPAWHLRDHMTGCAAPRHPDDDRPETRPHAKLCLPCERGLARDLRRLPALHASLEHIPATGGGDGTGLPFSEPAADCRSQITHDVQWWTFRVMAVRHASPTGEAWHTLPAMCGWLHGQVTWCSFRDWAPDMAGAISADRARAVALLDPWVTKTFELPGADGVCLECAAGRMVVTVYVYAADSRKSFIGCTACPARWEFGGAWLPFLKRLKQRRDAA